MSPKARFGTNMKKLICVLLALILLCSAALSEIDDDYIRKRFAARKIVGGAVIVSKDGEVLYSLAYGYQDKAKKRPVTLDTCFRIASVTKMVSALGLVKLCEEQDISYDTPLKDLMGIPIKNPRYPDDPITVRQVLTHTTSIAPANHYGYDFAKVNTSTGVFTRSRPGTEYTYSNLNGGLIGGLIETLSGQSVNTYMTENIFAPLNINAAYHAGLLPDRSDISDRLTATGQTACTAQKMLSDIGTYEDFADPAHHLAYTAGELMISANGLNTILTMLSQGGQLDGKQILPEGTVDKMMESQVFPGSSVQVDDEYTLGLARVTELPGGTWYGHQGRKEGLSSDAFFQPSTGLCVTVIANGYTAQADCSVVSIAKIVMEEAYKEYGNQ